MNKTAESAGQQENFPQYPVTPAACRRLDEAFTYHETLPGQLPRYRTLRSRARELAYLIVSYTPQGREQDVAIQKLEEAVMFANAAIARGEELTLRPKHEKLEAAYSAPMPDYPRPRGFGLVQVLLAIAALAVLCLAGVARADEPQFGACWDSTFCIAPRVAAPAMAIDLDTAHVTTGVLPGFGYGFEQRGSKIQYGLAVFVNLHDTAEGNRLAIAPMFSFMRYIHTGPMRELGGDGRWYWLLTLGTDLGSAPAK